MSSQSKPCLAALLVDQIPQIWTELKTSRWSTISALTLWMFTSTPAAAQQVASTDAAMRPRVMKSYGELPLSFEENRGQSDERVKYLARGPGYSLFLTSDGAILELQPANSILRMDLLGANVQVAITGTGGLPGRSNYFVGSDPKTWYTNIPTYGTVKYTGIYPGIDLIYHGSQRVLEYDFLVAPGGEPQAINLHFQGARKLSVNHEGALVIDLGASQVIQPAPVVYQEIGGKRKNVAGRYVLRSNSRVGFSVTDYDRTKPLVIDPTLVYSTYLGGPDQDAATSIAVDAQGNAYITGFAGSGFPLTPGTIPACCAVFVSKLNAAGSALVYSTYLGGGYGLGVVIDASGNAYVTGWGGANFPTTPGAFQTTLRGSRNAFVSKLNATGSALVYSTYLGGSGWDEGHAIAIDVSGSAYLTGRTSSSNFPTTASAVQSALGGPYDAFVAKLNPAGSSLVYSTYLGGIYDDVGEGIAVDALGNAYITGGTGSPDFPTTPGVFRRVIDGQLNVFVSKLNSAGSALIYSTYLAATSEWFAGIAIDAIGNAYVTGATNASNFPVTPGAFQASFGGGTSDAFVFKLNAVGSAPVYCTFLGGNGRDSGRGIAVDATGRAYVTGFTESSNFPTTAGAYQVTSGGSDDAFVSVLNTAGSALSYSTYVGGSSVDVAGTIAVDAHSDAYIAGYAVSANFPITAGAIQSVFGGFYDVFVTKLSLGAALDTTPPIIVPQVSGTLGNNGWYTSNVIVNWSVTDADSGISSSSGCGATTLNVDTPGVKLTCSAVNGAGLFNSASVTIMIDKSPPAISGMPPAGCSLWPPNGKLVQVAIATAMDALSGLALNSFHVTGVSNEPSSSPQIVITPNGSGGFVVQLQADRLGNGSGRVYSLTATAADLAGNQTTATAKCTAPHDRDTDATASTSAGSLGSMLGKPQIAEPSAARWFGLLVPSNWPAHPNLLDALARGARMLSPPKVF